MPKYSKLLSLLVLSTQLFALSPRLLIKIDSKCPISATEIASLLDAHLIQEDDEKSLTGRINELDFRSENHRIVIACPLQDLEKLAQWTGYAFLTIDQEQPEAILETVQTLEKEIPLTDESLPHITPLTAGLIYDLLIKVDTILQRHNLTYWATSGTLLGAVRHSGLIPWDDDLDICMFQHDIPNLLALKDEFARAGLTISMHPAGFYKISKMDGKKINIKEEWLKFFDYKQQFDWTFPSIDIFPVCLDENNNVHHACPLLRKRIGWKNEFYMAHELTPPLILLPFGPTYIPAPRNREAILERFYGEDWNRVAYAFYNHEREEYLKKIKVALTNRAPIPYIMPL